MANRNIPCEHKVAFAPYNLSQGDITRKPDTGTCLGCRKTVKLENYEMEIYNEIMLNREKQQLYQKLKV